LGVIARVATTVDVALAASWNPFVKSNSRASRTTPTTANRTMSIADPSAVSSGMSLLRTG